MARRKIFLATLVAMFAGAGLGALLGPKADALGEISKLVIQALKCAAIPLLFLAIIESALKSAFTGRGARVLGIISAVNGCVAIAIALAIVNFFKPGQYLQLGLSATSGSAKTAPGGLDWARTIASVVPDSIVGPFASGSTPAVIVLALLIGFALRGVTAAEPATRSATQHVMSTLLATNMKIIEWLVTLMPLAVFASVARSVGQNGFSFLSGLGIYLVACIAGMAIQIGVTYQSWILLHPRIKLSDFWRAAREPALYAFGINSSLATMPLTLSALEKLGVKEEAARLSACVGTNFNNDGILLYEVAAALLLAQALGTNMSVADQLWMALVAVAATLGVSGFPEAGAVALTLVLTTLNLPVDGIIVLLAVDWIVGRCRSVTNVLSDMTVGVGIDRYLPD